MDNETTKTCTMKLHQAYPSKIQPLASPSQRGITSIGGYQGQWFTLAKGCMALGW
jgi:hypothetical protein